jgi:antitoxin PrlF
MATATITRKGQTTIPKSIREYLKLKTGDRLDFVIGDDGRVTLTPRKIDIRELRGILSPAPRRLSVDEMDELMRDAVARKYAAK